MSIYLGSNKVSGASAISVTPKVSSGTNIADITIGNTTTQLYTPNNNVEYDFETTLTPSIDARGTYALAFMIYPVDVTDLTISNIVKIKAYLINSSDAVYPLIYTYGYVGPSSTYVNIYLKSIKDNVQSTSSSTVTGTLHIIAPFEIDSVVYGK